MASLLRWISREDRDSLQRTKYSGNRSDDVRDDLPSTYFSEIPRFEPIPAATTQPTVNYERDEAGESENFRFFSSRGPSGSFPSSFSLSMLETANFGDRLSGIYRESRILLDRLRFMISMRVNAP